MCRFIIATKTKSSLRDPRTNEDDTFSIYFNKKADLKNIKARLLKAYESLETSQRNHDAS